MPRYRITASRVMQGYEKASFFYEAGEVVDSEHLNEGHLARLQAAGVVEPVAVEAPPPKIRKRKS